MAFNTIRDYNQALLAAIDKSESEKNASWDLNEKDRLLQLVDLVLEKLKVEVWSEFLPNLRGVSYMKLEGRIQAKKNNIRRIEIEREKKLGDRSYFPASRKHNDKEVMDVLEMMTRCLKSVSVK
jgi:hypothetical protein